jgi:methyl-accepting chemotaxis protein
MQNIDHETIELIIIAACGLLVLVQTIILLAISLSLKKAASTVKNEVEDLRASVVPMIADTKQAIVRIMPKVESAVRDLSDVAHDLKEISQGLKAQSKEVEASAAEIVQRVRLQTGRVDSMITSALDGVDRAGDFVASVVNKPVRQASAVLASAKAIVESLRNSRSSRRESYVSDEHEPFV